MGLGCPHAFAQNMSWELPMDLLFPEQKMNLEEQPEPPVVETRSLGTPISLRCAQCLAQLCGLLLPAQQLVMI